MSDKQQTAVHKATDRQHESNSPQDQFHHLQQQATENFQSCLREAQVFGGGIVKGTWDAGVQRVTKDPLGVAKEGAIAAATGLGCAAAAVALPELALGAGIIGLGYVAWDQLGPNHAKRNKELADDFNYTWNHHDQKRLNQCENSVAKALGSDGFHLVLDTTCGAIGGAGMAAALAKGSVNAVEPVVEQLGNRPGQEAMQRFVDGDSNALLPGRLPFKSEPVMKLEVPRQPQPQSPGLGHYLAESSREPKTGLPEHKF